MTSILHPVERFFAAYQAAVRAKDVDAFVQLYAENVVVFDAWEQWSYSGLAAWREMAAGWFDSLGTENVVVEVSEVTSHGDLDVAAGHAFVTYTGVSAEGTRLRSLDSRMSVVLRRKAGEEWKVVHEQTSAPADFRSKAVSMTRPKT